MQGDMAWKGPTWPMWQLEGAQSNPLYPLSVGYYETSRGGETAGRARKEPHVEISAPHNASVFLISCATGRQASVAVIPEPDTSLHQQSGSPRDPSEYSPPHHTQKWRGACSASPFFLQQVQENHKSCIFTSHGVKSLQNEWNILSKYGEKSVVRVVISCYHFWFPIKRILFLSQLNRKATLHHMWLLPITAFTLMMVNFPLFCNLNS